MRITVTSEDKKGLEKTLDDFENLGYTIVSISDPIRLTSIKTIYEAVVEKE